jgi:hypothetical protein
LKKPTKEDAEILLMMIQTYNTPRYAESLKWYIKDFSAKDYAEFKAKYPAGSTGWGHLEDVLGFYEFSGVLVSHGLLNENLFFDTINIEVIWSKIRHIIPAWQEEAGPAQFENFAWLAKRYRNWKKNVWRPGLKWKSNPN